MGPKNSISTSGALFFEFLLKLYVFPHVGEDGVLDREALMDKIRSNEFKPMVWPGIKFDDKGNILHKYMGDGYGRAYLMFYFALDSLDPNFFEDLRSGRGLP